MKESKGGREVNGGTQSSVDIHIYLHAYIYTYMYLGHSTHVYIRIVL